MSGPCRHSMCAAPSARASDDTERGLDWCDSKDNFHQKTISITGQLSSKDKFHQKTTSVCFDRQLSSSLTRVSEDGFWRLDWCDSGYWGGFLETWQMWLWWVKMASIDNFHPHSPDWCDSGCWGGFLETWQMWVKMASIDNFHPHSPGSYQSSL